MIYDRRTYRRALRAGWQFSTALYLAEEAGERLGLVDCEHEWTHLEDGKLLCIFCGQVVEAPRV